ncbi:MAG: DUF6502 family protein [Pseudomonadota bacterium]
MAVEKTSNNPEDNVREKLVEMLVPIASMLRDQGIHYKEFQQAYCQALVRSTKKDHRKEFGEVPSISEISIRSGLDRNLVAKYFRSPKVQTYVYDSAQILGLWKSDERYRTPKGEYLDLPFTGVRSFTELCKRVSGAIRPRAFVKTLETTGHVELMADGSVRLLSTAVAATDDRRFEVALENLRLILVTFLQNLRDPNSAFEQMYICDNIPSSRASEVNKGVREWLRKKHGDEISQLFDKHRVPGEKLDTVAIFLGQVYEPLSDK